MRPCPVCGGEKCTTFFHRDFGGMNEIVPFSSYDVVQCDACGMMFAGNIVESMPLPMYYALMSKYETTAFAVGQESNPDQLGFVRILLDEIAPQDSVLDVGCGEGHLLRLLKENGVQQLVGLEPSRKNCAGVQERWGIRAVCGALGEEIQELAGDTFDFIILDGVLEHLLSVQENIKQVLKYLAAGGKLCFFLPDLSAFPEQHDLYRQFSVEHINYFTLASMTNLMQQVGMRCIRHGNSGEGLYALWQRDDNVTTTPPPVLQFDTEGAVCMRLYLNQAKAVAEGLRQRIAHHQGREVYLWGAGTNTATLYQLGLLDGVQIAAIVDSNANYHGRTVYGAQVIPPEDLRTRPVLPIIISSETAQDSIYAQITEQMGLPHEVVKLYG